MITPLHTRVILRTLPEENKTMFILKEEKSQRALVLAVGPKVRDLKVDDLVLVGKYGGDELKVDGEVVLFLKEEDVWAVLEERE